MNEEKGPTNYEFIETFHHMFLHCESHHGKLVADATIEEIAKELEVEKEEVIMSLDAIQEPVSLQEKAYSENTDNLFIIDQIGDKKNTDESWIQHIAILEAVKKLSEKEKMIINKRFFEGRTQVEVADEIGISQAQVSRLEKTALNHIRRLYK